MKWYYGMVGVVDVINLEVFKWFYFKLLIMMKEYGIDGLKLYVCESNYLFLNYFSYGLFVNFGVYIIYLLFLIGNLY